MLIKMRAVNLQDKTLAFPAVESHWVDSSTAPSEKQMQKAQQQRHQAVDLQELLDELRTQKKKRDRILWKLGQERSLAQGNFNAAVEKHAVRNC